MKTSKLTRIILALLCFALLAGCGGKTGDDDSKVIDANGITDTNKGDGTVDDTPKEKDLRIAVSSTMGSIDASSGQASGLLLEVALITETLIGVTSDFEIFPNLATEWERTGDSTWQFSLRQGVKFHDGTDFNAEAVKWFFDRVMENSASIKTYTQIIGVEIVDDYTVEFTTENPSSEVPECLTNQCCALIAPSSLDSDGNFVEPIGTGY